MLAAAQAAAASATTVTAGRRAGTAVGRVAEAEAEAEAEPAAATGRAAAGSGPGGGVGGCAAVPSYGLATAARFCLCEGGPPQPHTVTLPPPPSVALRPMCGFIQRHQASARRERLVKLLSKS